MLVKSRKVGNSRIVSLPKSLGIKGYPQYQIRIDRFHQVILTPKSNENKDPFNVKGWNRANFVESMKRNHLPTDFQDRPIGKERVNK